MNDRLGGLNFLGWMDRYRLAVLGLVLLLVSGVALLVAGCRPEDGTMERVQSSGVLRVGVDASFPPFEMLNQSGEVVGADADLAELIATDLGASPEFVNVGFDGLYDALQAERVDVVVSGLPYDPRRTRDVIFSQPYFNAGQVLVVAAGDADRLAAEGGDGLDLGQLLAGKKVAVEWGSMADMEARHLKETVEDIQILPQQDTPEALLAVVSGRADAAVVDAVSFHQFNACHPKESGDSEIQSGPLVVISELTDEPYVIATRYDAPRLAEAIDENLTYIQDSGQLKSLLDRWLRNGLCNE